MNDLISRQAAIDTVAKHFRIDNDLLEVIVYEMERLPSAQPEPCEDAVSRQRLLSDLKELTAAWGKYPVMAEQIKGVETAIGYVETIPSAQPERKTGKWVEKPHVYGVAYCSLCDYELHTNDTNFCPNCGADMRGDQNE